MITIYTDGSSRGNPGPGGWGSILIYDKNNQSPTSNHQWVTELGGRDEHTTNNKMELTACIRALEFSIFNFQFSKIEINTDSEYVMKGITQWIKKWQLKNWRTAAKKAVLNQDLWQELLNLTEGKEIEWKYVAGHSGHVLNDRADEIATSFADNLDPNLYNGPKEQYRYK